MVILTEQCTQSVDRPIMSCLVRRTSRHEKTSGNSRRLSLVVVSCRLSDYVVLQFRDDSSASARNGVQRGGNANKHEWNKCVDT